MGRTLCFLSLSPVHPLRSPKHSMTHSWSNLYTHKLMTHRAQNGLQTSNLRHGKKSPSMCVRRGKIHLFNQKSESEVMSDSLRPYGLACQPPHLPMGFSRQEYRSGLPFSSPGALLNPGIEPASPALAGKFFTIETPGKPCNWMDEP